MAGATINLEIQGGLEITRIFGRAPEIIDDEMIPTMWEAELLLEREIKEGTPIGVSGNSRASISAREPKRLADNIIGEVGSPLKHILAVELGTKPHYPPIRPLEDWVRAKLGLGDNEARHVAFLVQRKIGRKGTDGAFMFKRGFEANEAQIQRMFEAAHRRVIQRMGGRA